MDNKNMFANLDQLLQLVRGNANSQSFAMINSVMAETVGMSMYNAVSTQHNAQILNSASTTSTCARILSVASPKQTDDTPKPPAAAPPATSREKDELQW